MDNFQTFCEFVRNLLSENYVLEVKTGKRYHKLMIVTKQGNRSVWGFVDKNTGDILKAATFNQPAKHSRGNIHILDSYKDFPWTGPSSLK